MATSVRGTVETGLLTPEQISALKTALDGRILSLCFGGGVDSTGMIVALHEAGIAVDIVTFADTGDEKPQTLEHVAKMNTVLKTWGWPSVNVCRKVPLPETGYSTLYGNCWKNETLPSLAFGLKSCSVKWKQVPQDQFIKGVKSGPNKAPPHPVWTKAVETGQRIVKLIGYDCGKADMRRSSRPPPVDADFDYVYPLQIIGWTRANCVAAIARVLGPHMVPIKSACYHCPASKPWELYWLAAHHPELLDRALELEYRALTGKHSRFDAVEFGGAWEELVRNADRFPSAKTTIGLGRSFAWNHWARVNGVTDESGRVRRDPASREIFLAQAGEPREADNALDGRAAAPRLERQMELEFSS